VLAGAILDQHDSHRAAESPIVAPLKRGHWEWTPGERRTPIDVITFTSLVQSAFLMFAYPSSTGG